LNTDRKLLAGATLLSLLLHGLVLSLTFGGEGVGLPGLGFPWQERRAEVPDVHIVLQPAPPPDARQQVAGPPEAPPVPASIERPGIAPPDWILQVSLSAPVEPAPGAGPRTEAGLRKTHEVVQARPVTLAQTTPVAAPEAAPTTVPVAAPVELPTASPERLQPPLELPPAPRPEPALITTERREALSLAVPPAPSVPLAMPLNAPFPVPVPVPVAVPVPVPVPMPAPEPAPTHLNAPAPSASAPPATPPPPKQLEVAPAARIDTAAQEAQQRAMAPEAARLEAQRKEATRQAAARAEATRQEAARQEATRLEAARLAAQAAEHARLEAERQNLARQEAARLEATRLDAARLEAARLEAARQAAASQEAARLDAARLGTTQAEEARRDAVLRAIGRQLDEEAARRDAASPASALTSRLAPSSSGARRGRLFGRSDANAEMVLYAEAWARKIQLNMTLDIVRDAARQPYTDPVVTVAVRSDGSVESVTFVLSSGVAGIDEAIRRIVQSQVPYPPFPPPLAREYDVIEIRRNWHFDTAVRLY
jgi:TolA protein